MLLCSCVVEESTKMTTTQLSQEELGQKLLAACNVLYSPNSDRNARKAADEWLNSFRCTEEAWMISHSLLSSPSGVGQEVLFFAAQTLHTKIRSDFEQLPPSSHGQLCQSIIQHVCSFSAGPRNVLTKLCLALSALAVRTHSSDMWLRGAGNQQQRDVVGCLIDTFVQRGGAQSAVCLLEVLHVVLAENNDQRLEIDDMERDSFEHACQTSAPMVLQFLSHTLQNSGSNVNIHQGVFRCLTSWIHVPRGVEPRLSAANFVQNSGPLIDATFQTLSTTHLFDVGVDACLELIRTYWDSQSSKNMVLVQRLFPAVVQQLERLQRAMVEHDNDVIVGLTRLFVEIGESYMSLIVGDQDVGQLAIVQAVLACTEYRGDPDVGGDEGSAVPGMTMQFWYYMGRMLRERNASQAKMLMFAPCFRRVAEACVGRCVLPRSVMLQPLEISASPNSGQSNGGMEAAATREGKKLGRIRLETRVEYALCLKDVCVDILGYADCVLLSSAHLKSAAEGVASAIAAATSSPSSHDVQEKLLDAWCNYEGRLFAASAIANHRESKQYPSLQSLGELVACANSVASGSLPGVQASNGRTAFDAISDSRIRQHICWCVQRTTISLVFDETYPRGSCIGLWMERHPSLLSPMLHHILGHLVPASIRMTEYLDISMLAGEALRTLCWQCPVSIDVSVLQQFYQSNSAADQQLASSNSSGGIDVKLRMAIIESVCHVINVQQDRSGGMNFILTPLATALHHATGSDSQSPNFNVRRVTGLLDAIHVVVRSLKLPSQQQQQQQQQQAHPLVAAVMQMWPMFERVAQYIASKPTVQENVEIMMEKLCRVYKHVLRNSDNTAIQLLPTMLQQMTTLYATHPLSPALNMIRICIKDYANHSDDIGQALVATFRQCVTHTSERYLNSLDAMSKLPYLVDDFFLLVTTCIKSRSPVVRSVFDHQDMLTR